MEMAAYRRWGFRSMVSLPLVAEGRPIGLIDVFDTRVRDYTSTLDFIRGAGRLLAGAFEKAMLVERLESGNRDLRVLTEAGIEFGATLDVDAVLGTVAQRILEVSSSDLCDIYGLVEDEPAAEVLLSLGREELRDVVGRRYAVDEFSTFAEAARTAKPVVRLDVLDDPRSNERDREDARNWGYTSIMTVPLLAGGEPHRLPRALQLRARRVRARGGGPRPRAGRRPGDQQRAPVPRARRERALDDAHERVGAGALEQPRPP